MKKIAIIMGSDSDLPIAESASAVLTGFAAPHAMRIMSAHRTPDAVEKFAKTACEEGFGAIIAIAGKAAHLAGVLAANTILPVIGVPVKGDDLGGLDALLSTVQMPSGIPVATMAINGGANAAYLALRILALEDAALRCALEAKRDSMAAAVNEKDDALQNRLSQNRLSKEAQQ